MLKDILWIVFIAAITILPIVLWRLLSFSNRIKSVKEYAQKPFVCPNCGEHFHVKWYKLFLIGYISLELSKKARLRCPKCGIADTCRWMNEANN